MEIVQKNKNEDLQSVEISNAKVTERGKVKNYKNTKYGTMSYMYSKYYYNQQSDKLFNAEANIEMLMPLKLVTT